jgi:hypothetical protein
VKKLALVASYRPERPWDARRIVQSMAECLREMGLTEREISRLKRRWHLRADRAAGRCVDCSARAAGQGGRCWACRGRRLGVDFNALAGTLLTET